MTPEQLKASILQYAFQGKLVEQKKEDGNADELFQSIQEKATNKKLKMAEIQDEEKEYDIPTSWKWVRLGSVCNIINGFTPKKSNPEFWTDGTIPWFTIEDVRKQGRFIEKTEQFISEKALSKGTERIVPPETVLLCCTASVGEYAYTKIALTTNQQFNALVIRDEYKRFISSMYIYEFVQTLKKKLLTNAGKTTFSFLSVGKLSEMVIPIPPLKEQQRIVAKIEELLPNVDRYAEAYEKLEQFNAKFPEDMKKSILQYAIQGKLVEQRPEEGTAEELYQQIQAEKQKLIKEGKIKKEKPLPEISEDEVPFDIPESWKWCRLGDCVTILGDGIHGTPNYTSNGEYYFINGNNLSDGNVVIKPDTKTVSYEEYEKHKKELSDHTVFVSINGTIGNVAFYNDEKIILGKSACYFNLIQKEWKEYIYWIIKSDYFFKYAITNATGSTIKNVSLATMKSFLVPLPPLKEQHRIVAKIEELLPYCDRLAR